ncbi:cytochrome P450 [Acrasis kona]|uniref:Cytochrome P450 n=1 Tax=Acrasis kona TaxID=1008807 RepID=A0AAW2ZEG6_9EUKA
MSQYLRSSVKIGVRPQTLNLVRSQDADNSTQNSTAKPSSINLTKRPLTTGATPKTPTLSVTPKAAKPKTPQPTSTSAPIKSIIVPTKEKRSILGGATKTPTTEPIRSKVLRQQAKGILNKTPSVEDSIEQFSQTASVLKPVENPDAIVKKTSQWEMCRQEKDLLEKGTGRSLCQVGDHIWEGGAGGQLAVYDSRTLELVKSKCNLHVITRSADNMTSMGIIDTKLKGKKEYTRKVWSGFSSGRVLIWNAVTAKRETDCISCHSTSVTSIVQVKDSVWTASMDGTIRLWESDTLLPSKTITESAPIRSMLLVENESNMWIAMEDGVVSVRHTSDGDTIKTLDAGEDTFVQTLVYTNGHVWGGCSDGTLCVWNAITKKRVKLLKPHDQAVNALCASTEQVWSASVDKSISVHDATTLKGLKKIRGSSVWVTNMAIGCGHLFATCSDKKVRWWSCLGDVVEQRLRPMNDSNRINSPRKGSLQVDFSSKSIASKLTPKNDINSIQDTTTFEDFFEASMRDLNLQGDPSIIKRRAFSAADITSPTSQIESRIYQDVLEYDEIQSDAVSSSSNRDPHLKKKSDTNVTYFLCMTMHNAEIWGDDVEQFRPERFIEDPSFLERNRFEYLPFSSGPRSCIGQPLAQMEMWMIISKLMSEFNIELENKEELPEEDVRFSIVPKNLIRLIISSQ